MVAELVSGSTEVASSPPPKRQPFDSHGTRRLQSELDRIQYSRANKTEMAQQGPQLALANIPRVVLRPTWDNTVAAIYLLKVHTKAKRCAQTDHG